MATKRIGHVSPRPYSSGLSGGPYVFVSGQIPVDPTTGAPTKPDVAAQTEQVITNVEATVFLTDMADFEAMNHGLSQPVP